MDMPLLSQRQKGLLVEYERRYNEHFDLQETEGVPLSILMSSAHELEEFKRKIYTPALSYAVSNGDGLFWEGMYRLTEHTYDARQAVKGFNISSIDKKLRLDIDSAHDEEDKVAKEILYHQCRIGVLGQQGKKEEFLDGVQEMIDSNLLYHVMDTLLHYAGKSYKEECVKHAQLLCPSQLDDIIYSEYAANNLDEYMTPHTRDGVCWVLHNPDGSTIHELWERPQIFDAKEYSHKTTTEIIQDVRISCEGFPFKEMMKFYAQQFLEPKSVVPGIVDNNFAMEWTLSLPQLTDEQNSVIQRYIIRDIFKSVDIHRYAVFDIKDEDIMTYSQARVLSSWVGKPLHEAGLRCSVENLLEVLAPY